MRKRIRMSIWLLRRLNGTVVMCDVRGRWDIQNWREKVKVSLYIRVRSVSYIYFNSVCFLLWLYILDGIEGWLVLH